MTRHERPELTRAVALRRRGIPYRDIEMQTGIGASAIRLRTHKNYDSLLRQYARRNEWRKKCLAGEGDPNVSYRCVSFYPRSSLSAETCVVALPRLKCLGQ